MSAEPTNHPALPGAEGPAEAATLPPAPSPPSETLPPPAGTPAGVSGESPAPALAASVAGYEIVGELGRGGMGVVYKARQTSLDRLVALKMILAGGHAGAADRARFRAEAEAVARLRHPHIVQVYEVGEHAGQPFFSLEYVEGGSLADKLDGTPWPAAAAARLVRTLALAVHAAHQAGVVHRDLKPANVLLTADGQPKVTDFGLAKRLDAEGGHTQTGAVVGTPSYMAPEQAGGRGKQAGPAADVYALGAILYELLTGRPPFRAATPLDTVLQVVGEEPVPPRRLQSRTPRDLETVCLKCLEKEPARRYADAAALADDLGRFLEGRPVLARPVGAWERARKWARRRPAAAALVAVSALAAAALLAGSLWYNARLESALAEARDRRQDAETAAADAAAQRTLAEGRERAVRRSLYAASINLALRASEENNAGEMEQFLAPLRAREPGEEDLRGFEWHYLWRLCHAERLILPGHQGRVIAVAYSPDGRLLATGSSDRTVKLWDAATGRELAELPGHTTPVTRVAFSADGRTLVSVGMSFAALSSRDPGQVKVWDVAGRREARPLPTAFLDPPGPTRGLSPDGKLLACGGKTAVTVRDLVSGKVVCVLNGSAEAAAFSSDGRSVATAVGSKVTVWDARTGRELHRLEPVPGPTGLECLAFSPDGRRLASASGTDIKLWDPGTGRELGTLKGHAASVNGLAFSPDGQRLASGAADLAVKVWDVASGQDVRTFKGHGGGVAQVAFSPDGRWLASGGYDGTVRIWDTRAPAAMRHFGVSNHFQTVAFSPDGKLLATGELGGAFPGFGHGIRVWDVASGRPLFTLGKPSASVYRIAISPDGKTLAAVTEGPGADRYCVTLWDLASRRSAHTIPGVLDMAWAADGRRLALVYPLDPTVRLWDLAAGRVTHELRGHPSPVLAVAFSKDGARLASTSGDVVKVWDAAAGKEVRTLPAPDGMVDNVSFGPGHLLVAAEETGRIILWDAATGAEVRSFREPAKWTRWVRPQFSPDGRRVVAAVRSGNGTVIKLWDPEAGLEVFALKEPSSVFEVALSPDGRRLAYARDGGPVVLLDAAPPPENGGPKLAP